MTDIENELTRLDVKNGDVLVLRGEFQAEQVQGILGVLARREVKEVTVIILSKDQGIEAIGSDNMREMGWVRLH